MQFFIRATLCLLMALLSFSTFSQITNDFRSNVVSGSWSALGSWQRYDGINWVAATALPGATANNGNVTIRDGHAITVTAAPTAAITSIAVGEGVSGVLNLGAFAITITGVSSITSGGGINITSATGTKTFTGDLSVNGTWNNSANSPITLGGNIANAGTFNAGTGLYLLNAAATRTITGNISFGGAVTKSGTGLYTSSGTISFAGLLTVSGGTAANGLVNAGTMSANGGLTCTSAGNTFTNNGTFTVGGATFSGLGGFINGISALFNYTSTGIGPTTFTVSASGNTVVYNSTAVAQTVRAATYHNLTIAKTNSLTASLTTASAINGNFAIDAGIFVTSVDITGNASGTWTMGAGATYRTSKGNVEPWLPTVFLAANISLDATSEIDFSSAALINFTATAFDQINNTFPNLRVSGASTKTLGAAITVNRNLTITAGAIDDGGNQITGNAAGVLSLTGTSALLLGSVGNATVFPTNYTIGNISLGATSTVTYKSNQAQLISNLPVYGILQTTATGSVTKSLAGNTSLTGTLNNGANNTLQLGNFDLSIAGGTTPITNSGTISAGSSGSANIILTGSQAMTNITNAGTLSPRFNLVINNTVSGGVTMGGSNVQVYDVVINSGCQLNLSAQSLTLSGSFTNNGTLNATTNTGRLILDGTIAQSLNSGTLQSGYIAGLTINNTAGVTLLAPLTVGIGTAGTNNLTLTSGLLNTSSTNILTLNTLSTISGGSNGSYINGPARRIFGTSAAAAVVPVGQGGVFTPVSFTNVSTTANTTLEFEVISGSIPGTLFPGLSGLNTNRHWNISVVGTNSITTYTLAITETGSSFNTSTRIVRNDAGLLIPATSSGSGAIVTSAAGAFGNNFGLFSTAQANQLTAGTYSVGPTGDFQKLYQVAIALNGLGVSGPVVFEMQPAYNGTIGEVYPIVFNQFTGGSSTNTVIIRPAAGATALQTTGSINGQLIDFNGADWITFDGRPGGSGSATEWTFDNSFYATNAAPNTFRLVNASTNNTFTYLNIRGSGSGTASPNVNGGAIHFGTSAVGGNANNTVSFSTIAPGGGGSLNTAITSSGSASNLNASISILNNRIYDFFEATGKQSAGIYLDVNNGAWTVTGNSFYQTASRTFPSGFGFAVIVMISGTGHTISDNFIGGSAPACGGTAWETNGPSGAYFRGILLGTTTGGTPASLISNNTIRNFNYATGSGVALPSATWAGIQYSPASAGNQVSITGNTIGSTTVNGSIVSDISANASEIRTVGIIITNSTNGGSPSITNNTIAGIRTTVTSGGQPGHSFAGIFLGANAGSWSISGNTIGSTLANSISTDFTMTLNNSTQTLWGIYSNSAGTVGISNNTVRNLTNYSVSTTVGSSVVGIMSITGINTISNNTIHTLTAHSNSINATVSAPLIGVLQQSVSSSQVIRNNEIYGLTAVTTGAINLHVYGIYNQGQTAGTNRIEDNFVHSLSNGATGTTSMLAGIYQGAGLTPLTIQNNMVRMGLNAAGGTESGTTEQLGIILASTGAVSVIYNSVYVGGTAVTGSTNSFAFRRLAASGVHLIRNNIFENFRSNGSGTGTHYAVGYAGFSAVTADYNLLRASGTGGAIGLQVATPQIGFCEWLSASGQDANSINFSGNFIDPTGTASTVNLKLQPTNAAESRADNNGISAPTADREGDARSGLMDIGADEGNFTLTGNAVSTTVTVGSGGTYSTLTGACGLFSSMSTGLISGNTVATIISDITEPGTFALSQWAETGAGNYTLTIQSDGTLRTIVGNYNGSTAATDGLIRFNGADRVTITGGVGSNRNLVFRNTNTGLLASVIQFLNDASNSTVTNCILESAGSNTSTGGAIVTVGSSNVGGTGNSNIVITNNRFRERSDIVTVDFPAMGVYGGGLSASVSNNNVQITNNIFENIHRNGARTSAILVGTFCSGWTISGNTFPQIARNVTLSGTENWVIYINSGTQGAHTISNNTIENWTITGSQNYRFAGIYNASTASTAGNGLTITGNIVRGISMTTISGASTNYGIFSGIYSAGAFGTFDNNIIGSLSADGNISVTSTSNGGLVQGIRNQSSTPTVGGALATTINGNTVGGITAIASGPAIGIILEGITSSSGGMTIGNNIIGAGTVGKLIVNTTQLSSSGVNRVTGIAMNNPAAQLCLISNNSINGLESNNTATSSLVQGINTSGAGQFSILGNTVINLTASGSGTGTGPAAALVGIFTTSTNSAGTQIIGNTVHSLVNLNAADANYAVSGIVYSGTAGTVNGNRLERNTIHSLVSNSTSIVSPFSQVYGIVLTPSTSAATVANNMIRLGIAPDGSSVTRSLYMTGIEKLSTTQVNVYHNSVYLGGLSPSSGTGRTAAYRRTNSNAADRISNNLFINERSSLLTSGTVQHFAVVLNNTTLNTMNGNIYLATGNLSRLSSFDGASTFQQTFQALQAAVSGQNAASAVATMAQVNFISATGNAAAVNLRLNAATAAAGMGINGTGVTTDIDNVVTRPTPPSIGAHEGSFNALNADTDIFPPAITLGSVASISAACGAAQNVTVTATVTDAVSGIAGGSLAPTLWWRLSTGTYASMLPSSVAGNSYTYTLALLGISAGQTYHYYVAAQDLATVPNIAYSNFNATTPVHSDVSAIPSPINAVPATFSVLAGTPLSGTIAIGGTIASGEVVGQTWFSSLSRFDGFFRGVFDKGLSSDLTVLIRLSTAEDGNFTLINWSEFCGSGYTITIRPESASMKTLSGSLLGMGLISIQASRVIIDGRFNGVGTDRYLTFGNTYSGAGGSENDAIKIGAGGSPSNVTIRYCNIESNSTKAAGASLYIASGSSNILIENNHIRGAASYVVNAIRSDGSSNVTIKDNEIYNMLSWTGLRCYGILVPSGGSNWTITGNSIYNGFINGQSANTAIAFTPGTSSHGNLLSGNFLGGNAPLCGGDAFRNSTLNDLIMLEVSTGNDVASPTIISDNTIQNVWAQSGDGGGVTAMYIRGSSRTEIRDNIIGHPTLVNSLQSNGGGDMFSSNTGWVYGIDLFTTAPTMIEGNTIAGLAAVGSFRSFGNSIEVRGATSGAVTLVDNIIANSYNGANTAGNNYYAIAFSNTNNQNHIVRGNSISMIGNANSTVDGNYATGMLFNGNNQGALIENNTISDLFNSGNGGESNGIHLVGSNVNFNVLNNMINLNNRSWLATYTTRKIVNGIHDWTTTGTVNVHYNTVYVQGSQTGTASFDYASACYYRLPSGTGTGSGSTTNLRNNIFINARTGNPTVNSLHYAIDNTSTNPTAGWSSNNNFLMSAAPANLGYWGTGAGNRTFVQWQSVSGGDANSYTAVSGGTSNFGTGILNPPSLFIDPLADLHISQADGQSAQFVNDRGITVGTTGVDFDGNTRNASTPDLGADEFGGCVVASITTQPIAPAAFCEGSGTANISVSASGDGVDYQWRRNGSPISDNAIYSGTSTATLSITSPTLVIAGSFDVVVTGDCGAPVTSDAVSVTVDALLTWYLDADGDSFAFSTAQACSTPGAGYTTTVLPITDCNDSNAAINPNTVWYLDEDGDGFAVATVISCDSPGAEYTLTVLPLTDCNDTNGALNPNTIWHLDADGDGFALSTAQSCTSPGAGYVLTVLPVTDCNDSNGLINPTTIWHLDADGDGYSVGTLVQCVQLPGYVLSTLILGFTDCNDSNSDINPGADEWCNGEDDNCDGNMDEGVGFTYYQDADSDGFGNPVVQISACAAQPGYVTNNLDCNDSSGAINPNTLWYLDADSDGFASYAVQSCVSPGAGFTTTVLSTTDCDDFSNTRYPGAPEICGNNIDEDCDELIDEGCIVGPPNDARVAATTLAVYPLGTCISANGTVVNASVSPESNSTVLTGQDVWYKFVANSVGVRVVVAAASFDAVVELQDAAGNTLNVELAVVGAGTEMMNYYNSTTPLILGQTYFISVRNYNSVQGAGTFTICVQRISASGCNSGPGPYASSALFKSAFTGATTYTFTFTNTTTLVSTVLVSANGITQVPVASLPLGFTYTVSISATYIIQDGNSQNEIITVPNPNTCSMSMISPPAAPNVFLRTTDQCPAARPLNAIIGANVWTSGALNYEWRFRQTSPINGTWGSPVAGPPTNRFINITPLALAAGATYDVEIRIVFSGGAVSGWGATRCVQMAGTSGMMVESNGDAQEPLWKSDINMDQVSMEIYPNPSNGERLWIYGITAEESQSILIRDVQGKVMSGFKVVGSPTRIELVFDQTLASGIYFIEVKKNNVQFTRRWVIQR